MRWIAVALVSFYLAWVGRVEYLDYQAWDAARYVAQSTATWVLPTPVTDASVALLTGPRVARFGLSMQMPGEVLRDEGQPDTMSLTRLINGGTVIFFPLQFDDAEIMRHATPAQARTLSAILGSQTIHLSYEQVAAAMQETPAAVTRWDGRARNTRSMILLLDKAMAMGYADAIHPVSNGTLRGFQFGDPSVLPYVISLELFDAYDRQYQVVIGGTGVGMAVITQGQINAMIASMKTTQ